MGMDELINVFVLYWLKYFGESVACLVPIGQITYWYGQHAFCTVTFCNGLGLLVS